MLVQILPLTRTIFGEMVRCSVTYRKNVLSAVQHPGDTASAQIILGFFVIIIITVLVAISKGKWTQSFPVLN